MLFNTGEQRAARPARRAFLLLAASVAAAPALASDTQPKRLVAVGGAITEIVYALGAQDRIVGVDTTSLYPEEALKTKAQVGYMRALSAEGVLSLTPDLVLTTEAAGPPDALRLLEQAGLRVERLPEAHSQTGLMAQISRIGAALALEAAAKALSEKVEARFTALAKAREAITQKKRILIALSVQNDRLLVGGRGTAAQEMITLAGGLNAADALEGYKPMSREALLQAQPDLVVVMARSPADTDTNALKAVPVLAELSAVQQGHLLALDGHFLLGFGPRAPLAAARLMAALYGLEAARQEGETP